MHQFFFLNFRPVIWNALPYEWLNWLPYVNSHITRKHFINVYFYLIKKEKKKKKKRHLLLDSFNRLPIKLQFVIMINYTLPIIGYLYYPFDLREVLYLTYFYNKFRCSVVIGSNLNPSLKLIFCPPVIVYHLRFIVKLL